MSGIKDLASKGRNGDNMLMHVSTDEVAGLNALAKNTMGRELTTNPDTGLPEAFLFAPFLAPLVAGGMGLGGGALATGLVAGGLGAAEAELRGMDDPLKRGLFAGLTAGAASGIGNALTGAADAGTAAAQMPTTGAPEIGQAVKGAGTAGTAGTGFSVANPPAGGGGGSFSGAGDFTLTGQPAAVAPTPNISTMGQGGMYGGASLQAPGTGASISGTGAMAPTTAQPTSPLGQYADAPRMGEGLQNVFRDEGARQQFMQDVRAPATAGFVGLGGQAQLRAQDEMKDRQEAADAESAAELKEAQDRIRANYAAAGRPMPTGFGGGSLFADGGIVNLRRGGPARGARGRSMSSRSGPDRGARGRSMSSKSSSSSRGGGGGSTHPGRPGGESGTRSLTRSGGGGSSAAVQQPQIDPNFNLNEALYGDIALRAYANMVRAQNNPAVQIGMSPSFTPLGFARNTGQAVANSFAANNASDQMQDVSVNTGIPYGTNTRDLGIGYNAESMNRGTFGVLGNETGVVDAMTTPAIAFRHPIKMGIPGANPYEDVDMSREAVEARSKQSWSPKRSNRPEGGGGNDAPPIIPQPAPAAEPTLPLMATPTPTPNEQAFLAQLQQGAGNRRAMQTSGYTGMASGGYLDGGMLPGDGMSDDVPATIDGDQPAALSSGEFVIPADVVSHIGNGSSDAGAKELYNMMDRIREARTGKDEQAPAVDAKKMMPK